MIALGYHPDDILTDVLPFGILLAIIVASPPGTAVRWAVDEAFAQDQRDQAPPPAPAPAAPQQQPPQFAQPPLGMPGGPNRAVDIEAMRRQRGPVSEKVTGFDSMTIEQWERVKAENWARPPSKKLKRAV